MTRKKKYKMSSDAMEAAEIKNRAEEYRKNAMAKIELKYHRTRLHETERLRKAAEDQLATIHDVCPVTYAELKEFHDNQHRNHYNVFVHIVNCYMARQEENKETWRRMRVTKDQPKATFAREKVNTNERLELHEKYLEDIPVKSDDHIAFIARAFPEFFMLEDPELTLERDWSGELLGEKNIYSGPRASHDRKCMSTRVQPIGRYPFRFPLNFKKFIPPPGWPSERTSAEPSSYIQGDEAKLPTLSQNVGGFSKPRTGGFSKLDSKRTKQMKTLRRGSMMGQTGTSMARQLDFKLPRINI